MPRYLIMPFNYDKRLERPSVRVSDLIALLRVDPALVSGQHPPADRDRWRNDRAGVVAGRGNISLFLPPEDKGMSFLESCRRADGNEGLSI
jgi:hypothetical protein